MPGAVGGRHDVIVRNKTIRRRASLRRALACVLAVATAAALLVGLQPPASSEAVPATHRSVDLRSVSGSDFNPGNIISDANFFSTNAMSTAEIQSFLDSKCSGSSCLNRVSAPTFSRGATNQCPAAYNGGGNESAAAIIFKVQQACGISARAILVILQKEQSLVTRSNPSAGVLEIAMGYGCPDTAACDTEYYGLYNQIWNAASQLKRYGISSSFSNRYKVGVPGPILYNPNSGCGTLTVTVQNKATAALYWYTPYTPNSAALAAMPGTGDGCSSYGNRNFFYFYSIWFGSPTGGVAGPSPLVRSASDPTIYVMTASAKYPVRTGALFASLASLGEFRVVPQSDLDKLPTGRDAGNLLRDESSGYIYFASDGVKNPFPTCTLVAVYYSTCYAYIDLPSAQLTGFATGATMTQFLKSTETGVTYFVKDAKKRALFDPTVAASLAGGGSTASVTVRQAVLDLIPSGIDLLTAGLLVKNGSTGDLALTTSATTAIKIASPDIAAAFGPTTFTITAPTAATLTIGSAALGIAVTCGTAGSFIAGGAMLWPTTTTAGLPVTALTAATCAALPKSTQSVSGALFLRNPANGYIYNVAGGKKTFMATMAQVLAVAGSSPLTWVSSSQPILDSIPTNIDTLAVATLVKSATDPTIFLVDGASKKVPVPSFALLAEFGISDYTVRDQATLDRYTTATGQLSMVVTCGTAQLYVAGGGKLWSVASAGGLPVTALDAATCAAIPKASQSQTGPLFLRVPSNGYIYLVDGGGKRFMSTMAEITALNGSNPLVWVPTSQALLDTLTTRVETIAAASLVKSATDPTVFMIDGPRKIPVPSFALMSEFGISGYTIKAQASLDGYTTAPAPMSVAVTCGTAQVYVAGAGQLWPVASAGGLPVTALDAATCATIPTSSQSLTGPLFMRIPSNGYIYYVADGTKQFMSTMAQILSLAGSAPLAWVPTNQTVMDSIPTR